jgi:hypothetical protein
MLLEVSVRAGAYGGTDQCWVVGRDWHEFVVQLTALESRRSGRACLEGASPRELRLEFYATDGWGHMALKGHLGHDGPDSSIQRLEFSFAFEAGLLSNILADIVAIGK